MKVVSFVVACFLTLPALAADAVPAQTPAPQSPVYSVWSYHAVNGQWVRDEKYCWNTPDATAARDYAQRVDAVPGWTATTNCPPQHAHHRFHRGWTNGAPAVAGQGLPIQIRRDADGGQTIYTPFATVRVPAGMVSQGQSGDIDDSAPDFSPTYDDGSALQQSIATQDMLNQQQMNNNVQDMINTQNFNNTENMINSQNAANAMNP